MDKERKREIKQARIKKSILIALQELIKEIGYDKMTMDLLAEKVALSRATLYNYFESKEDLFIQMGMEAYAILEKMFQDAIDPSKSGIDQIQAIGYAFIDFHTNQFFYRKALDYAEECQIRIQKQIIQNKKKLGEKKIEKFSEILKNFEIQKNKFVKIWVSTIQNAIDNKSIRQDIPATTLAMTIGTLMSGLLDELLNRANALNTFALSQQVIIDNVMDFIRKGLII